MAVGGNGSGNWYRWSKKDVVEDYRWIEINRWNRERLLHLGRWFHWVWKEEDGTERSSIDVRVLNDAVELSYTSRRGGEEPKKLCYQVTLTYTDCRYGGRRPWFVCPNLNCQRRVAKLYAGGSYFLCRHCYDLVYLSQNEATPHRLLRQIQRVRRELGGSRNVDVPFPEKPKGMHWSTYHHLKQKDREMIRVMDLTMMLQCLKWTEKLSTGEDGKARDR